MPAPGSPIVTASDSPRNLPGLQFWANAGGVSITGSLVDKLIDQSGNGRDATSSGAARPVWGAATGPNGKPSMTFAATQRLDTLAYNPNSLQLVNIYVVKPTDVASARIIAQTVPGSGNGGFQDDWLGASSQYNGQHYDSAGPTTCSISRAGVNNTDVIVEVRHDKTIPSGQVSILVNGVLGAQVPVLDTNCTSLFGNLPLTIGIRSTGILGWIGTISEMIQCNQLLTAQQSQWLYRGYLGPKYGISVP